MHTNSEQQQDSHHQPAGNFSGQKTAAVSAAQFADQRPETQIQRQLQENIHASAAQFAVARAPVAQLMKVSYRGYEFDLGPSGPAEIAFMQDHDAYVLDWYTAKVDAVYHELTQRYDEIIYGDEIVTFCDHAMSLLDTIHDINNVLTQLTTDKNAFIEEAIYKYPIAEAGLGISDGQTRMAIAVYKKTCEKFKAKPDTIKVTGSSGAVVTFIMKQGHTVVQYYISSATYGAVKAKLQNGMPTVNDQPGGIAHILDFWDDLQALITEKVKPIAGTTSNEQEQQSIREYVTTNAEKIYNDIVSAVIDLHQRGLSQGDVSLDNTGLREMGPSSRYVLFDFNLLRQSNRNTVIEDIKNLDRSFTHWKVKIPKMSLRNQFLLEEVR